MSVSRGLWKHLRTGHLYYVEGLARWTHQPTKQSVIYAQTQVSQLRETGEPLSKGTLWIRDLDDFQNKFERVPPEQVIQLIEQL